jgi:hypothetical protein
MDSLVPNECKIANNRQKKRKTRPRVRRRRKIKLMLVISKCGIGNIKKKTNNYLNLHTNKTEFSILDPKLC